ncbi:MAG: type II toxin-antitoxin system RelE/ParE family toxin [Ignavibacteria bacterium]|nr:type II toxin-antitoxin system RelE/ParE family toxin [Ignavibacteria bacterium]
MAYKIVWLKGSIKKLENIILYLEENWSKKVSEEFLNLINYKLLILSGNPQIGMRSEKKPEVRKILIAKQIYLFYTTKN